MLTDTDARRLLHEAADTIDVVPAGPLAVPPHRPWWPVLAAAAAVAVVVFAGLTVGPRDSELAPAPAPPTATEERNEPPGRVPSVFGYAAGDAASMLHELGYTVDVDAVQSCETQGRAIGLRRGSGRRVTVVEAGGSDTLDCLQDPVDPARADAWELIDLVNGRDSDLDLAPTVRAYVGRTPTVLSAEEVATWSPLVDLVTELSRPVTNLDDGTRTDPSLLTRRTSDSGCGGPRPRELKGRSGLVISIGMPTDGEPLECRVAVLYRDGGKVVALQIVHVLF